MILMIQQDSHVTQYFKIYMKQNMKVSDIKDYLENVQGINRNRVYITTKQNEHPTGYAYRIKYLYGLDDHINNNTEIRLYKDHDPNYGCKIGVILSTNMPADVSDVKLLRDEINKLQTELKELKEYVKTNLKITK